MLKFLRCLQVKGSGVLGLHQHSQTVPSKIGLLISTGGCGKKVNYVVDNLAFNHKLFGVWMISL